MHPYDKTYFDYQKIAGNIGGQINLTKFTGFVKPTDTVLDFGCGGGYLLKNLPCKKKLGVEINPVARATCAENGLREIYENFQPINTNSVDLVISNHALEHVEEPLSILREIHRVLRPGGKVVLYLPYDDYRNAKIYNPKNVNFHLYTWNVQLIGNCLDRAGFKNIQSRVYVHAWPKHYNFFFGRLPRPVFDFVCLLTSIRKNRRQVMAVAEK